MMEKVCSACPTHWPTAMPKRAARRGGCLINHAERLLLSRLEASVQQEHLKGLLARDETYMALYAFRHMILS